MSKVKVFIEATAIVPDRKSGIGHLVLEMVREIDKSNDSDLDYILFVPLGEARALRRYNFKHVKIQQLPFPHRVFSILSRLKYSLPIDLLIGRGVYIFPNYRNLTLLHSKSLTYIHDVSYALFPQYTQPKNLTYLKNNMRTWLKRADRLITISNSSKSEILELFPEHKSKLRVTKPGVDKTVFYPRSKESVRNIKQKYNLSDEYFLYVGNIEPRKNLKTLIDAYSSDESLKPFELFLVGGGGWLNDDINASISVASNNGYKIVRNQHYVEDDDIPILMTGAVAVVLPSHHEGFGLSVIQAQACGTAVITSDIPVLREVGGSTALFFDNNSHLSLKRALAEALKKSRSKSRMLPEKIDTWKNFVDNLKSIINEVI